MRGYSKSRVIHDGDTPQGRGIPCWNVAAVASGNILAVFYWWSRRNGRQLISRVKGSATSGEEQFRGHISGPIQFVVVKEESMSMKDKAKNFVQTSRDKVEKATGKVLGNEDMPAKEQMEELKGHLKNVGDKVVKSTGRALGDEDMPVKDQVEELKAHLKDAGGKVRDAFKKDSGTAD